MLYKFQNYWQVPFSDKNYITGMDINIINTRFAKGSELLYIDDACMHTFTSESGLGHPQACEQYCCFTAYLNNHCLVKHTSTPPIMISCTSLGE